MSSLFAPRLDVEVPILDPNMLMLLTRLESDRFHDGDATLLSPRRSSSSTTVRDPSNMSSTAAFSINSNDDKEDFLDDDEVTVGTAKVGFVVGFVGLGVTTACTLEIF